MQVRFTAVMAVVAMLSVFAGVGRGQAEAQPKPLVNADVVKMVKAGLGEDTLCWLSRTSPALSRPARKKLIRLKEQGVMQVVLNAMLNASKPVPAAPPPPEPPPPQPGQQMQSDQAPRGSGWDSTEPAGRAIWWCSNRPSTPTRSSWSVWRATRTSTSPHGPEPTSSARRKVSARRRSSVRADPTTSAFLPTTFSYSIGQVDASVAEAEVLDYGATALDLSRVLAPKMVTMNTNSPPAVFLSPQ